MLDRQYKEKQFFWVRDKKGTTAEIDFIWQTQSQIVPIEVKAGTNSHLRSLHSFVNAATRPVTAVRFWSGEYSVQDVNSQDFLFYIIFPKKRPYPIDASKGYGFQNLSLGPGPTDR